MIVTRRSKKKKSISIHLSHYIMCIDVNNQQDATTGATVEMERQFHLNRGTGRQQCRSIVPKAVYTVKKRS